MDGYETYEGLVTICDSKWDSISYMLFLSLHFKAADLYKEALLKNNKFNWHQWDVILDFVT